MEKKEYTSPYDFEGKIPLKQAIILGLQPVSSTHLDVYKRQKCLSFK